MGAPADATRVWGGVNFGYQSLRYLMVIVKAKVCSCRRTPSY